MTVAELLADEFERVRDALYPAVNGLSPDQLTETPAEGSNSIAWLAWHLTRIQDRVVSSLAGQPQVWTANGWSARFSLDLDDADTGYGHDASTARRVTASAAALLDYFEDVHRRTVSWVGSLDDATLAEIVDEASVPPATVGSRLVDALVDDLQHVGQAAYVRGLLQRRRDDPPPRG